MSSLLRLRNLARNTLVILIATGALLFTPLFLYVSNDTANSSADGTSADSKERFGFEQQMVKMGKTPLVWDCHENSRDQARIWRNACFAEHILEIDLAQAGTSGNVTLIASGDASFSESLGIHQLSIEQTDALRSTLIQELPKLSSYVDNSQVPEYSSAIEACVYGRPLLAIRSFSSDVEFERLVSRIAQSSGVELTRTSIGTCM